MMSLKLNLFICVIVGVALIDYGASQPVEVSE